MKYIHTTVLCVLLFASNVLFAKEMPTAPQPKRAIQAFRTTIYTDSTLTGDLAEEEVLFDEPTRGFGADLLNSLGNAALGIASGYISSVVDLGIQAVGQLFMMDRRHHEEWMETAAKECLFTNSLGTLYAINDFYHSGSDKGALDPTGFQFDGVGCVATIGEDTSFYVSCHLNRQKLHRIRDHSKFEMILDTVIINPYHSHLPNSTLPLTFSFAERKIFNFKMTMKIKSSWMDSAPSLHKDEVLGEFVLDIPIDSTDLNEDGVFVYVRSRGEKPKYELQGESFIVPRSYMQVSNGENGVRDHFGTGQYSLDIAVEETCELADEYKKAWRADRKYRKSLAQDPNKQVTFDEVWKTITHQTWDESLKAWVVTILKAPADYSIKTMNEELRLK